MDSASQDLYFQKIQELVEDDDKIATVTSLASSLGISVQNSRNLISKYLEDQRRLRPDELAVTYVISGTLKDNGKKGVFMAKETDLQGKRELFETKPCEVIYSIQKNKNVDFNIIALMDMFSSTNIRETALSGSVVSKNCIKRTLKFKKLPSPPPPTLKGKSSFFAPKVEASSSEKPTVSPKNEQKAKASGNIANLFKAAASKPRNVNNSTSAKPNKPAAKSGGLAGFLSSGSQKSPKAVNGTETKMKTDKKIEQVSSNPESQNGVKEEQISDVMDTDFDEEPVDIKVESKPISKNAVSDNSQKKSKTKEKQKGNKRHRDKSKELPSKKRKRIIERNDSDSDDMFEKEDDTDIIEKSDEEPERISSPVVQTPVIPKNKRRKTVTRNYEDEEGFIVTKTEYVYETASEDENIEPEPPKKEKNEQKPTPEPAPKSKVTDKKKPAKNQATLMNFFKKK